MVRKKNLYQAGSSDPFKLSRSKIDNFLKCPRCFYMDRKLGISQPSGPPFTLNNAVDALLKKEFDGYREKRGVHPFIQEMELNAIPYSHTDIENWRNNRVGIQYLHPATNFMIYGAIDDIWQLPSGELAIVDYKAKATTGEITLEPKKKKDGEIVKTDRYLISYKKQIEIYQWLFRMNGFKISSTGYFVFANALKDRDVFGDRLDFEKILVPYEGDDSWVESTILSIFECLKGEELPEIGVDCDHCSYRIAAQETEQSDV